MSSYRNVQANGGNSNEVKSEPVSQKFRRAFRPSSVSGARLRDSEESREVVPSEANVYNYSHSTKFSGSYYFAK